MLLFWTKYEHSRLATFMSMAGTYLGFFAIIIFLALVGSTWLVKSIILVVGITACVVLKIKAKSIAYKALLKKIKNDWVFADSYANDHPDLKHLCLELNPIYAEKQKEQDDEYQQGLNNIQMKRMRDRGGVAGLDGPSDVRQQNNVPTVMDLYKRARENKGVED